MGNANNLQEGRYRKLIESINGIVWEAAPYSMRFTFVSESVSNMLGYAPEEWHKDPQFWLAHIYEEDRAAVKDYFDDPAALDGRVFNFRMTDADGNLVWIEDTVSVIMEGDEPKYLCGVMMDITVKKRLSLLEHLEKDVLALNAEPNTPVETVLDYYLRGIEQIYPAMKCSVLRIADGKAYNWASPSIDREYIESIDGLAIGPNAGSCGTAAYFGTTVIVTDIALDEKWADFREVALRHELRACWSHPIMNSVGAVVGTFAIYYPFIKSPDEGELDLIKHAAALLRVILENRAFASAIMEMNMMAASGQELANFGTWQWDCKTQSGLCSDTLCQIFGRDKDMANYTLEEYMAMVHADDKERVRQILEQARATHGEATFEERIVLTDGRIKVLKSWFKVLVGENGVPEKYLGACLDITSEKAREEKMRSIAWLQSHVARAPLARVMGLITLLKDKLESGEAEREALYDAILHSANELDSVIRTITFYTEDGSETGLGALHSQASA